jgi:FkbM family methyltransferase
LTQALRRFEGPAKRVPGVLWLYAALYRRLRPSGLVRVEVPGGHLWVDAADEGVGRALLARGSYESAESELFARLVKPGMTVVDVGANVGYYTVLASRLVGPAGRVLAFEPEPRSHALLARNVAENGCANVRLFAVALSERGGEAVLFADRENLGTPSLVRANVDGDAAAAVTVATATLDETLAEALGEAPVDLLKIDVQGAEKLVLAGADRLLRQPGLQLLLELWPPGLRRAGVEPREILDGLAAYGFRFHLVDDPPRAATVEEVLVAAREHCDGFVNLHVLR